MAKERTTNVNINYIVNRADVERAEAVLKRASVSTDNLRKSTQQFTSQAGQGYRFASKSIEGMEIEVARLRQQIKLQSTSNTTDIKKLSDQYKVAVKTLEVYKKELLDVGKATQQNSAATKEMSKSFGQMFTAVKLFLTAGIAREILDITLNMAKLSGNVEGVSRAFNRLPGAQLVLEDLRKATHGTLTEMELMQQGLRAFNFGISLKALPALLEFVNVRAQQTGVSVDYLANSLIDGIGRKSLQKLDNLQISISRIKEELGGVSIQAASVTEVSEAMGRIASEELEKMGGFAETTATQVEQLTVAFEQLKVATSQRATQGGLIEFFTEGTKALTTFIKAFPDGNFFKERFSNWRSYMPIVGVSEFIAEYATNLKKLVLQEEMHAEALRTLEQIKKQEKGTDQERFDFIQQEINSRVQLIGKYNDTVEALKKERALLSGDISKVKELDRINLQITGYQNATFAVKEAIVVLKEYLEIINKTNKDTTEQLGLIEQLKADIENKEDAITTSKSREEIAKLNKELEVMKGRLHDLENLGLPKILVDPKAARLFGDVVKSVEKFKNAATDIQQVHMGVQDSNYEMSRSVEIINRIEEGLRNLADITKKGKLKFIGADVDVTKMTFGEKLSRSFSENWKNVLSSGLDDTANFITTLASQEVDALDAQLNRLREFYDEQQLLAGNNEKAKSQLRLKEEKETNELRRRIAQKEKENARFSVIVNTAIGIIKAIATSATIYDGLVNAAIVAAQGAAQLIAINKAPMRFAKGVIDLKGPGTGTSDSIGARLSKGESVMTAKETQSSRGIFKAVRAQKLNDKILKDIVSGKSGGHVGGAFDDTRIIKGLDDLKKSQPDYVEKANMVYRVNKKGDNFRQFVRSKSMGK